MSGHVDLERLASLALGPDSDPEAAAHVRSCPRCEAELDALRRLDHELQSLPGIQPPADEWDRVRRRLSEGEGADAAAAERVRSGGTWRVVLSRAAAAVLLLGAGYVLGSGAPERVPPDGAAKSPLVGGGTTASRTRSVRAFGADLVEITPAAAGKIADLEAGLLVVALDIPGPGAEAGLEPGDILQTFGGNPLLTVDDVLGLGPDIGEGAVLVWTRNGQAMTGAVGGSPDRTMR